jgi:transposase InsO family protein
MSRKGNCWDNAVAESFFKTLKAECIYQHSFRTREQADFTIFEYIETWYNRQRRHSHLNQLNMIEYQNLLTKKLAA